MCSIATFIYHNCLKIGMIFKTCSGTRERVTQENWTTPLLQLLMKGKDNFKVKTPAVKTEFSVITIFINQI